MLPFFKENLPLFTGKFYVFHRKTHDFSSKLKNQGIENIDTRKNYRYFPVLISIDKYRYFSHHQVKQEGDLLEKQKSQRLSVNVLIVTFFGKDGIVYIEKMSQKVNVMQDTYQTTLEKLMNRPHSLKTSELPKRKVETAYGQCEASLRKFRTRFPGSSRG